MDIVTAIVVLVMIWWLVFFMTLPLWRHRPPSTVARGHDPGAPGRLRLIRHLAFTSLISLVLLALFLIVRQQGWISLRPAPSDLPF